MGNEILFIAGGLLVIVLAVVAMLSTYRMYMKVRTQNSALLRLQKNTHMGSWEWNVISQKLWWSDEAYRIFGYIPQQFIITDEAKYGCLHGDDHFKVKDKIASVLTGDSNAYEIEYRIIRVDGSERLVVECGEIIRDNNGSPLQLMGTFHDVTDCRRVTDKQSLFENVFKESGEAIVITAVNGEIIEVNDAFTHITGYEREAVVGRYPSFLKSDQHSDEFYVQLWQQVELAGCWSGEIWERRKDGVVFPKALTIRAVKNGFDRVSHYIGVFSDITQSKLIEKQLQKLAFYDELTSLPNRTLCKDRLNHEIKVAHRRHEQLAVLFLDLDRFKYVNDTLGHSVGDLLLLEAAHRILGCVRETDTVARLGGDEFMVILTDVASAQSVKLLAEKIIRALSQQFILQTHKVVIGASIGISLYPDSGLNCEDLIKNADAAMYRAKDAGRNTFMFFTSELQMAMSERLDMEKKLRNAIELEAFELYYQPKIDLRSGKISGVEALLRWPGEDGVMVMPDSFIPLAEETGLIIPLGAWVLQEACRQAVIWRDAGFDKLRMAVNLSIKQFDQVDIVNQIETVLQKTGLPPELLELEVTESMVMRDADRAIVILEHLRKLGVHISVDDFGTGYSSLSYLKRLPLQTLKIDSSFVKDLGGDGDDEAIVSAIISMANTLELKVVAEGVETFQQLEFLRRDGCSEAQGYLFSCPVPAERFAALLDIDRLVAARRPMVDLTSGVRCQR